MNKRESGGEMIKSEPTDDPVRKALKRLIEHSNAPFGVEDVFREFRTKGRRHSKKLMKVLEIISQGQPNAEKHLQQAQKDLDEKDSVFCLFQFLENYSDSTIMQAARKKDISHSTPLNKLHFDSVTSDNVSEIRDRVVQAAIGSCPRRSGVNHSSVPQTPQTPNATLFTESKSKDNAWDFQSFDYTVKPTNVIAVPTESQETCLMFDLIYCLTGMRGSFIVPEPTHIAKAAEGGRIKFNICEEIHQSLRDIAQEILPLASHYTCVQKFVQKAMFSNCGQVLQALSEALNHLLRDYFLLLAQMENELDDRLLTMHKILFYVRPTLRTMEVLADIVADIVKNDYRGGQALTLLFNKINSLTGDGETQKFVAKLTQLATVPYMNILQLWIQKGVINDPQHEFLVEDNELIRREDLPEHYSADYWERRYTIRRDRIPVFLEKVSDIILRTGKYLNVIRQCGKVLKSPLEMNLEFSPTNQNHILVIQKAYRYASRNLLDVLLTDNDLMGHLMSVKRYLLLHQGDFITQFMDACEEEFAKNVDQVLPMTLENLLGLTLRLSSAKHDPYKDDVHCELLTYDLVTQMSKIINNEEEYWQQHDRLDLIGLECFAFRYDVKWPVSLVLNHIAISKYQMLFRQLFYCKHVERQLCKIWKENSVAKKFSPHAAEQYRSAFTLRQRMMNAVQNLEYYMMIEVIEPNWHVFIQNMNKVENVDEVLTFHQDFLDSCLKNCMLTDTTVLNRSIFKLCNVALKFCEFIQTETSLSPNDTFAEIVKRLDLEFTGVLLTLLKQITDIAAENPSDRFINLVHRINFNSFYNTQMEMLCAKDSMAATP